MMSHLKETTLSPQSFKTLGQLMTALVAHEKAAARNWTLSRWSIDLGLKSKSLVTMIVKGQRVPSAGFIEKLSKRYGWSEADELHVATLARRANEQVRPALFKVRLEKSKKAKKRPSHHVWLKYAVREICLASNGFDVATLREALAVKPSKQRLDEILKELIAEGILTKTNTGYKTAPDRLLLPLTASDIQGFHEDCLKVFGSAITSPKDEERAFHVSFLRVSKSRFGLIKTYLQKIQSEITREVDTASGESVYQLGLFLVPVMTE